MQPLQTLIKIFNEDEITIYKKMFFQTINEIKDDYMKELSVEEFDMYYINFESVVMKAIGYRFYLKLLNKNFFNHVENVVKDITNQKNEVFMNHPIFYTRIAYPEKNDNQISYLSSQPHFDRSYMLPAYTVWLALNDINEKNGGLCFFKKNKKIEDFFNIKWGMKNKFNYDLYDKNHKLIDPIIKKNVIHPNLSAGEAYLFNSYVLHGGTRALSKNRLSFDFRFIKKSDLNKADEKAKKTFELFNKEPENVISKNLYLIGDHIQATKINPNVETLLPQELVKSRLNIKTKHQKMSWRYENSFI